ncbi:MAG: glycosyltransferase family 2 protein, partial [Actinobacteria bacterium]|nr:glycosyltransferase family 2 protein [Actinomycetota bacterium]
MDPVKYSIVIPIYNEQESLPALVDRLRPVMDKLDGPAEVVLVDDGSRDCSYPLMIEVNRRDPRFKIVQLSRNFGHQIAITAGMDAASGEAVVVMDADLQDPPEVILQLAERWQEGYEVVYAVREQREGESLFKRKTATMFYGMQRRFAEVDQPAEVGDFRLIDRKALDAFLQMRERNRYVRGMFSWIGYRQTAVPYRRASREAGESKYPLRKMLRLALDGFIGFSTA